MNISPSYLTERREILGARLKDLRERGHILRPDMAAEIGISDNTLWRIESGKYSPNTDLLEKILMVLDCQLIIER
jgi:DNA-binding XRE family transcriptional regulator